MHAAAPEDLVIDTRAGFEAALPVALGRAAARGARRLWCVDADFADWPLDAPAWLDALAAWIRLPQRRLTLIASDYDDVRRRCPRFVEWRRSWAHAIEAYAPSEPGVELPSIFVDDGPVLLERLAGRHLRGRLAHDPAAARRWRDEIDALLQRCEPAFAPSVAGL